MGFGGEAPPTNDLVHILAKGAALVARFLWILLKRNNFLYKISHGSFPSMLHHAHRGTGSAYYKVGEANWQWVSWQTQIQMARMSRWGLVRGRFWGAEDERCGPRRDAQGINEDLGMRFTISSRLLGVRGASWTALAGSGTEPRTQTDFCAFTSSKASQNVSCRDVCRNWRPVRWSLLMEKNIAFVRLEGRSPHRPLPLDQPWSEKCESPIASFKNRGHVRQFGERSPISCG